MPKRPLYPKLLVAALLTGATAFVYLQTRAHGFLNYDDDIYVTGNEVVQRGLTWEGLRRAFTAPEASNWIPLAVLSHMLDVELFGLDPGRHHLVSAALHLFNSLLLFAALGYMTGAVWRGGLVALLFAVHPLHVESVAWIAERKDLLCGLFWILGLLAYAWYARAPGLPRYIPVFIAFAAALMAKPMAVTLPFVLLLLDVWPLNRPASVRISRLFAEKAPLFLLTAGFSAVTFTLQQRSAMATLEQFPFGVRVANAVVAYAAYLGKTIWPADLAVIYPHPGASLGVWKVVVAAAVLTLITAAVFVLRRRLPYLAVGWFWYAGTLIPVSGVVQVGSQAMADRYTYIPLIGIFIAAAWGLADLAKRRPRLKPALAAACTMVVIAFAIVAREYTAQWRDSETLFRHAIAVTPPNSVARNNLGSALLNRDRLDEALEHFQAAVAIAPSNAVARSNLGAVLLRLGKPSEAEAEFRRALADGPADPVVLLNLAVALIDQGRAEEALAAAQEALAADPDFDRARVFIERVRAIR